MADVNDWKEVTSPGTSSPQAIPSTAVTVAPKGNDDWQEVSRIPTDPGTGQQYPVAMSGLSPETARSDKSVVDIMDRLKMSAGNTQGNIDYLKSKFKDVRPIPGPDGKPTSNIAVQQQDGSWFQVDPKNGDVTDPWERTKEYIKDAADLAPMIAGTGAALAAGPAVATVAGAGILAAGIGTVRTSLGRIVGTYSASPLEQAGDIALESLLNMAGVKIAAGTKPSASWIAKNAITPLAEAFGESSAGQAAKSVARGTSDLAESAGNLAKDAAKKVFAGYSVGIENFDTMVNNSEMVKTAMRNASARAGRNIEAYHDDITMGQMQQMKEFADNSRGMLSQMYSRGRNEVLSAVEPGFRANFDKPVADSLRGALAKGIAKLDLGEGEALYGKEALDALGKNPGLQAGNFKVLSQDEMKQSIRNGAELSNDLGYLSTNAEAHATVSKFYKQMTDFANSAERKGVDAAKDLLNFKRLSADTAYDLANSDHVASMPGVKRMIDEARTSVDQSIYESLNNAGKGAGTKFLQLNKTYADLSNELVPVLNAKDRYARSGDLKVYQGLLNSFLAKPGQQVSSKYAIDQAIDTAEAYGMNDMAEQLASKKTAVQVGEAAKAFNPVKPGWSQAANTAQAGLGVYALASHNPAMLAAVAGQAALRSPNTAGAAAATVRGLSQGQEYLSLMSSAARQKFMLDPQAIESFITGVTASPLIYQQTINQLHGAMQNAAQSGKGQ